MNKTISKVKRQPLKWEKIIPNETTDKELSSKIYKKLQSRKSNNPVKKWTEDLNRYFPKEDMQMTAKHMKRSSTSLIFRVMQIKTTEVSSQTGQNDHHRKVYKNNKCWRGCGKKGNPFTLFLRMQTDTTTMENSMEIP